MHSLAYILQLTLVYSILVMSCIVIIKLTLCGVAALVLDLVVAYHSLKLRVAVIMFILMALKRS